MNAKELRIGNWVKICGDRYWQCNYVIDYKMDFLECNPIPLTKENLLKLGFYELPHFTVAGYVQINIGRNRVLSVGCVGTPNEIVMMTEEEGKEVKSVVVLRNYDYDGPTYLHDIQNIYQSITKKELEIKDKTL